MLMLRTCFCQGLRALCLFSLFIGVKAQLEDVNEPTATIVAPLNSASMESISNGKDSAEVLETTSPHTVYSLPYMHDSVLERKNFLSHQDVWPVPSSIPETNEKQNVPSRKKPPSQKQVNAARRRLRPRTTPATQNRAAIVTTDQHVNSSSFTDRLAEGDDVTMTIESRLAGSEVPLMFAERWQGMPTTQPPAQIAQHASQFSNQPSQQTNLDYIRQSPPDISGDHNDKSILSHINNANSRRTESIVPELEETTTSTIITTTVITSEQPPVLCSVNFSEPEGYIDSADYPPLPMYSYLECIYNVTVYTGYGVELQVKSVNLSEGEQLSIRGVIENGLVVLANETLLVEGQMIRSPSNSISVHFRTFQDTIPGTFQFHYQVFMLSCDFPRRPDYGDVRVMDLHAGGTAHFHCHLGYVLQGQKILTCLNASKPQWSPKEPTCLAVCGGHVQNATIGRILSPNYPGNYSNNLFCVWKIETVEDQKLHLHFERFSLSDKKDRVKVYSGKTNRSTVLFDSLKTDNVPFEGVISDGPALRIEFTSDKTRTAGGFNIRFEAFERGHCYEPYIHNGNFTTSDSTYNIGTVVEFLCEPGYSLEQGPSIIECINMRDPYWNDTEPLCRALCGGELSTAAGIILSPNWPEQYSEGEDCIWRIHVGEEKGIFLDIQFLNLTNSDILTVYDGDEVTSRVLGQYIGTTSPQKLFSSTPDLTVRFHSDPAGLYFGKGQGFLMNYIEVSRNESCPDLPEIQNGWKTTSHNELVRGSKITYQCDPGYDIVGSDTLACQWDLTWSSDPPFCEKIMYCTDPGEVEHSIRSISDLKLQVGTTIQYACTPGFVLEGSSLLTCYSREAGTPIWTSRPPHCVSEESLACDNPGLPDNGYQILYKRLYLPGESLTFMCYEGFELIGEVTIKCILDRPSHWSGPLPMCKANQESFEHALEVAEAAAETSLEGGNMALAIFIPIIIISLLLGGAYIYITRCRYYSNLRLPLMYSHPYSQITVETEFDNPIYETGDTREYEVSI
ncbi:seizure 6-like protein [Protopterus annectens]|uniref:seizure 6-like protein n=1 Tax=Protopterus annectens TaxID=7888 RepID=UPI001CFBC377|nr:seizure 6-like protein [Protopterus annectens]